MNHAIERHYEDLGRFYAQDKGAESVALHAALDAHGAPSEWFGGEPMDAADRLDRLRSEQRDAVMAEVYGPCDNPPPVNNFTAPPYQGWGSNAEGE